MKQKKALLLFVFLGLFLVFSYAHALQTNWPPSPVIGTSLDGNSTLPVLIKYIYEWGISLGGLAAFIALIIAGFQYLTSMGDPAQMKEAFDRIRSAFFGIVLLLSSLLILNTINPDLTSLRGVEPFKVENVPEVEVPIFEEIGDPSEPCDKVEVYYTDDGGAEKTIVLRDGQCENVPVAGTQITASQAFVDGKTVPVCGGSIQFYAKSNCTTEVGTVLPPTNNPLKVSEENVNGVMLILP